MKNCNKCNESKELSQFGNDRRNADGKQGICNKCKDLSKKMRRESRASNNEYITRETKVCNKCGTTKPIDRFFKDKAMGDGHSSICKDCKKSSVYAWREANKDKYNASQRAFQKKADPEKRYGAEIKRRYGCTLEQYNQILVSQNGKCAICNALHNPADKKGRLYVDHDHSTGAVRALLCKHCNSMLGYAKDNIETLQKAIKYLANDPK